MLLTDVNGRHLRASNLFVFLMLLVVCRPLWAQPELDSVGVLVCEPFQLRSTQGKTVSLGDFREPYKVIAFLGTECPLAKLYAPRLNQLSEEFSGKVAFIGINSNCQDSLTELVAYATRSKIAFPMLKDLGNQVADQLTAERTPEVFLLDQQNRVVYRGRIDDQYQVGIARSKPQRQDLRAAINELTSGSKITTAKTKAVGCRIGRLTKSEPTVGAVTYVQHVQPILKQHCLECHQPGQIAPFALTDYDEVVGWGETIREVIEDSRMPPWHASPDHGEFLNTRTMPNADKQTVFAWIESGMPHGDASGQLGLRPDPTTSVAARGPKQTEVAQTEVMQTEVTAVGIDAANWRLQTEPDQVIAMSDTPFAVPAEGTVEYQYFVVDPEITEDRWISAAEVVPGNRAVVHHAIVFIRPPEGERQEGIGWLTAYVPGQTLMQFPTGMARRLPAGSKLVFQMHYTPTGAVEEDLTKVGLIFADTDEVNTEVQTRIVINQDFEIPPMIQSHVVSMSSNDFPPDSQLMAIAPHMHYRGHQFRVTANIDGQTKILLDVPNYDFNWQHAYILKDPLPLGGVTLDCMATFDNSADNLANPDPAATVRWGDQTWEEMAMAYLEVAIPLQARKRKPNRVVSKSSTAKAGQTSDARANAATREERAQAVAKQFFVELDTNDDNEILRAEAPKSFRAFAWRLFDKNDDGKLTWEEVLLQSRIAQQPVD